MNTYVTEMAEKKHTCTCVRLFFDDCCNKYYSLITGRLYDSCEDAEEDVIDTLTRNLNRITR